MGKAYPILSGSALQDLKAALEDSGRIETIYFEDATRLICKLTNFSKDVRFHVGSLNKYVAMRVGTHVDEGATNGFKTLTYESSSINILYSHIVIDSEYLAFSWTSSDSNEYNGFQFLGKASNGADVAIGSLHYNYYAETTCNWVYIRPDGGIQDINFSAPVKEMRTADFKYISTDILIFDAAGLVLTDSNNVPLTFRHLKSLTKARDVTRGYQIITDTVDIGTPDQREIKQLILEGGHTARGVTATTGYNATCYVLTFQE